MSGYRELMRRKLLEDIYNKMSPEEKRTFIQLTLEDKNHDEIMQALGEIKKNRQTWISDFSSNIAGNAVWDGILWIGSRLLRRL